MDETNNIKQENYRAIVVCYMFEGGERTIYLPMQDDIYVEKSKLVVAVSE